MICRKLCLIWSAMLLLAFSGAKWALALSPSELFRRAAPSVVLVLVFDDLRTPIGLGSGVVVAKDRVITNCHVTDEGSAIYVERDQHSALAHVVERDSDRDLCLLQTETGNAPIVRLRRSEELEIGEQVYAIGNPRGLPLSLSPGLISQIRDLDGQQLIQTTAPISPGSSGGALFDEAGLLVGVTVASLKESQNLNFAIPVDWVDDVLQKVRRQREQQLEQAESALRRRQAELDQQQRALDQMQRQEAARQRERARSEQDAKRLAQEVERERTFRQQQEEARRQTEAQLAALQAELERLRRDSGPAATAEHRATEEARKRQEIGAAASRQAEVGRWRIRIHDQIKSRLVMPTEIPNGARAEYMLRISRGGWIVERQVVKSSGYPAYDQAIERAITTAEPLPVPSDLDLLDALRELNLVFRPAPEAAAGLPSSQQRSEAKAGDKQREFEAWKARIKEAIQATLVTPPETFPTAYASFKLELSESGEVLDVELRIGSGYPRYDDAIKQAIVTAAPLPVPSDPDMLARVRSLVLVFRPADTGEGNPTPPRGELRHEYPGVGDTISRFSMEIQSRVGRLVKERGDASYPRLARDRRWEGTSQVRAEFGVGGTLKGVWISVSSGYAVLDQRAIEMVKEVLPSVPNELRDRDFTIRFPIVFKLVERLDPPTDVESGSSASPGRQ